MSKLIPLANVEARIETFNRNADQEIAALTRRIERSRQYRVDMIDRVISRHIIHTLERALRERVEITLFYADPAGYMRIISTAFSGTVDIREGECYLRPVWVQRLATLCAMAYREGVAINKGQPFLREGDTLPVRADNIW